jgi:hypothetical protein
MTTDVLKAGEITLGLFDRIWSGIQQVQAQNLSAGNYLRAYYLEVKNNLELLQLLKDDALTGKSPADPGFLAFIGRLQTQVGASLLFDQDKKTASGKVFARLQNQTHLLLDISYTVTKIELLKRIAEFSGGELELIRNVKLQTRLDNISSRLRTIIATLAEVEGIKELYLGEE